MSEPSTFARITADTLHTTSCREIIVFLRSSALNNDLLTPRERGLMTAAANSLSEILKWQTPDE